MKKAYCRDGSKSFLFRYDASSEDNGPWAGVVLTGMPMGCGVLYF